MSYSPLNRECAGSQATSTQKSLRQWTTKTYLLVRWHQSVGRWARVVGNGAELLLRGDAGVAGAADEARRRGCSSRAAREQVLMQQVAGRGHGGVVQRPGLRRQLKVGLGRRGVREARRHREEEIVREGFLRLQKGGGGEGRAGMPIVN